MEKEERLGNFIEEHGGLQSMGSQRETQTVNNNNKV